MRQRTSKNPHNWESWNFSNVFFLKQFIDCQYSFRLIFCSANCFQLRGKPSFSNIAVTPFLHLKPTTWLRHAQKCKGLVFQLVHSTITHSIQCITPFRSHWQGLCSSQQAQIKIWVTRHGEKSLASSLNLYPLLNEPCFTRHRTSPSRLLTQH